MAGLLGGQCHRGDGALWAGSRAHIQVILHLHCALIGLFCVCVSIIYYCLNIQCSE